MRIIVCLVAVVSLLSFSAEADNTTRGKRLRVENPSLLRKEKDKAVTMSDTVFSPGENTVILSGYDKPLSSSRESLLVTNHSDRTVTGLEIELTYLDMSGRELHGAVVNLGVTVPPGATRKADFPSWDIQRSYYYHLGKKPRTANVTPYSVHCRIAYILYSK